MTQDGEAFLDRWSRRKLEQAEEKPAPPAAKEEKDEPVVALPPTEELTPESDFVPFMNPKVDGETRRAALKKLFTDAHYNVPDPFEAYSEDYSATHPISPEILKTLNQAKKLLFDQPEKAVEAALERTETPTLEAKDPPGKQDA